MPSRRDCRFDPRLRPRPRTDKPADEATALAVKLTEEGAATFDTFNAKAMTDYYLDDAEIALMSKEEDGLKFQTRVCGPGRPGPDTSCVDEVS